MAEQQRTGMEALMEENRKFPPPPEFFADAHIKSMEQYEEMYQESVENPDEF